MMAQGWIPGSTLGATTNSPCADGTTDTSAPYLALRLRDGKCGLGRLHRSDYNDSNCTGLDVFQGILGRLNGRPEVENKPGKISSEDFKTLNYLGSRWQVLKFVSGGFLEGDKTEDIVKQSEQTLSMPTAEAVTKIDPPADGELETGIKGQSSSVLEIRMPKRHKTKRSSMDQLALDATRQLPSTRPQNPNPGEIQEADGNIPSRPTESSASGRPKKRRESAIAERKSHKKRKKAKENPQDREQPQQILPQAITANAPESAADRQTTPVATGLLASRHAVRQRYIKQKKMAMMDTRALNEVCQIFLFGRLQRIAN